MREVYPSPWIFVAVAAVAAGLWAWSAWSHFSRKREHTARFQATCAAEHPAADCAAWADRYAARCYDLAWHPGGKAQRAYLNPAQFERCLFNSGRLGR
ncbi:MAG: hypothetical protein H6702_13010 [Myxococcales bacterium]|nr:hypothetical protein [Myxococcales bacterium]